MNPYELLNLPQGASAETIKEAYLRLARQWHPDHFTGPDRELAEKRFKLLTQAYNMLRSPTSQAAPASEPAAAPPAPPARPAPAPARQPGAAPASAPATSPAAVPDAPGQSIELDHPGSRSAADAAPKSAADFFNAARKAHEEQQWEPALAAIQSALALEPEKYEFFQLQAKILDDSDGDKRALVGALEHCLRLNNRDADAAIRMAEIYQGLGMYNRATRYWEWARNLRPDHPYFEKQKASAKETALEAAEGLSGGLRSLLDGAKGAITKLTGGKG